ncbi:polysaccharide deacetylase family protein [Actinocatenispora rupis]|uniref:polysaccharide deacetylase family protein n=2 Tax=Actinocatenispora rupis TaxID=519421 RepID=UPI0031E58E30
MLTTRTAVLGAAALAAAATHAAPAVAAWALPRRLLMPGLAGVGRPDHVALTFDDGPDPTSTPVILDVLARAGVRATFFLVGANVAANPGLAAEIAAAGHELAVHGLRHRLLLKYPPGRTHRDLAYAKALVANAAGVAPRWFRPPFGVLSTGAAVAVRRLGMRTVLWSAWGRDWTATATGESVADLVGRDLRGGGTVLLHDTASDTAAPESWRATVDAVPRVLDLCAARGWTVGPLRDHGLRGEVPAPRALAAFA